MLQATRYLQKVTYYRESGFSEKSIHEAYETAGKDWDKALDILTHHRLRIYVLHIIIWHVVVRHNYRYAKGKSA